MSIDSRQGGLQELEASRKLKKRIMEMCVLHGQLLTLRACQCFACFGSYRNIR